MGIPVIKLFSARFYFYLPGRGGGEERMEGGGGGRGGTGTCNEIVPARNFLL